MEYMCNRGSESERKREKCRQNVGKKHRKREREPREEIREKEKEKKNKECGNQIERNELKKGNCKQIYR